MNDYLDFFIDGVAVRETDLTQFRTHNQLKVWKKRVMNIYRTMMAAEDTNTFSATTMVAHEQLSDFVNAREREIIQDSEDRKGRMAARNLDLVVISKENYYDIKGQRAGDLDYSFSMFDKAEQMTNYEFDAYAALGNEECDRQEIETLYDLFGTEFAEAFYLRKNALIAEHYIAELEQERAEIDERIAKHREAITKYRNAI